MGSKVKVISLILTMILFTPCFAMDTEWITAPAEGVTATLQIGESVSAGNYYASLDTWIDKFELVYTGCEGDVIHFLYREYSVNTSNRSLMIRDSYSIPLIYDFSKGKVIGYLTLKMEVIEFNNTSIKIIMTKQLSNQ